MTLCINPSLLLTEEHFMHNAIPLILAALIAVGIMVIG